MGAYGRIAPALPLKELNRFRFITTGFGQVFNDVRFRKLRMFLIIHGTIFHDGVGHWLGYRPQFALSTYSRKIFPGSKPGFAMAMRFMVLAGAKAESENAF